MKHVYVDGILRSLASSSTTAGVSLSTLMRIADPTAAGLDGPVGPQTIIILSVGLFLGSIAMGICGFGTAIIHLCVWAIAGSLGFDSGPLKLAVIACSCALIISMVPFFFLASPMKHAIRPLAISVPIFKALCAPLGALVLKVLPARQLEALVSAVMVVMMLLINKQHLNSWAAALLIAAKHRLPTCMKGQQGAVLTAAAGGLGSTNIKLPPSPTARIVGADDYLQQPLIIPQEIENGSDSDTSDCSSDEQCAAMQYCIQQQQHRRQQADGMVLVQDIENSPRSPTGQWSDSELNLERESPLEAEADMTLETHGFWKLFTIGSVTGICTGLLSGATGISGPPMMIMYAYLSASKDAVRGTNAVMAMVQDQVLGYWLFGLLRWEHKWVYVAAAISGGTGLLLGHSVQKLMDQRHFKAVMTGLMLLCFMLMSASAAGWLVLAD